MAALGTVGECLDAALGGLMAPCPIPEVVFAGAAHAVARTTLTSHRAGVRGDAGALATAEASWSGSGCAAPLVTYSVSPTCFSTCNVMIIPWSARWLAGDVRGRPRRAAISAVGGGSWELAFALAATGVLGGDRRPPICWGLWGRRMRLGLGMEQGTRRTAGQIAEVNGPGGK